MQQAVKQISSGAQLIRQIVVTADQMRQIEGRVFAAGMPVAALMEKVAGRIAECVQKLESIAHSQRIGFLIGPGHNGGDALVVARELHFRGYEVVLHSPVEKRKELTDQQWRYCTSLGIPVVEAAALQNCDALIDGLFGFGLERSLSGSVAAAVEHVNQIAKPTISIDLPSGLHTDTGAVLGTAIRADHTLCLGLWKRGLLQDPALAYVGAARLIEFDLPLADVVAIVGEQPAIRRVATEQALATLPLTRPPSTHKYKMGHLLVVCGSRQYAGGAILTGLGARASGVGMLSIAVPASLKPNLSAQLPEALILDCPETASGAIAQLPDEIDLTKYHAIACGPGLTRDAATVVSRILASQHPLVLDADGLNVLAQQGTIPTLKARLAPTVLTPHLGEFKRLFPDQTGDCRITATQQAAAQTGAVVLLKGACVAVAAPDGSVWINPASTPALARGGSGDVLTGLLGGLMAQAIAADSDWSLIETTAAAAWWHAQAGIWAAATRSQLGVDAFTLTQALIPALQQQILVS